MTNIFLFEFKRCFTGKRLCFTLCLGFVLICGHIITGVLPLTKWLDAWQGDYFLTPHSAYGHWIGMDSATIWPTLLYMLFPFLSAIPFSDTAFWDFDSGYCIQVLSRTSKRKYLAAKAFIIFLVGFTFAAFVLLLDFIGTTAFLPLITPEATTNLYGINNRALFPGIFYNFPLVYTLLYILLDALLLGAWNCLVLMTSVLLHDRLQSLLTPFLAYLLIYFVLNWLGLDNCSLFALFLPYQPASDVSLVTVIFYGLAVPAFSFILYFFRRSTSDEL